MVRMLSLVLILVLNLSRVSSSCYDNLLVNSDMELDAFSPPQAGWYIRGSTANLSSDSHTGNSSVMVTNRKANWAGMNHDVNLEPGKNYFFIGYIKLLSTAAGKLTDSVKTSLRYVNTVSGARKVVHFSAIGYMQPNMWQRIGGDFTVLSGYDEMRLYIQVGSPDVNYLFDSTNLTEIPSLLWNWDVTANALIDDIRKADINITAGSGSLNNLTLEITQERSEFAFGSAVSAEYLVDPQYQAYQDFYYDNFEWATIKNKLKWSQTESKQGELTYAPALLALDALAVKKRKVRGHTVFWGVPGKDPAWVQSLEGAALQQEMDNRVNNVTVLTRGKVEHWDVNNENVHGNFYEEATGNVNVTMDIFSAVNASDSDVKLFLNDFAVVNRPSQTQAYRNQAQLYRDTQSVPIYGVGIQSHLTPPVDLTLIKHRLDQIAAVGLPIWITELNIDEADHDEKADLLEDVLRLYFSHPSVEGIVLWGFWDYKVLKPNAALTNGPAVTPNAAGLIWQQLVKQEWRTHMVKQMDSESNGFSLRGFKGDYSLKVIQNGTVIQERQFVLGKTGENIVLSL